MEFLETRNNWEERHQRARFVATQAPQTSNTFVNVMLLSHVQAVGPFLRIFGQLNLDQMNQIQKHIDAVVTMVAGRSPPPTFAELSVDTICLARFMGKQYQRARVIRPKGANGILVQFIDHGNECVVNLEEIILLNYQCLEVDLLRKSPTQASPFILSGIFCHWTESQLNELNADLCGQYVTAATEAELSGFIFINIIWRNESLANYLVYIKKFGSIIPLEEQTKTFHLILTTSRGIVPVRQLHGSHASPIEAIEPQYNTPSVQTINVQSQNLPSIMQVPQIPLVRMPYRSNEITPNQRDTNFIASPPKRSVVTFKSNTLMVGKSYQVFCCFVENGPCLFSVQLNATEQDLNKMMNELDAMPLSNLTERPSIGMACIARFSEDSQLYRAVIMTIKPTACQVIYVDYGNTEVVPFANLYEIPHNLLDLKIFAIRFALSGYKELEPVDDALKNAFRDMVLHKQLRLKVMPLEGPPLVQYCELYDEKTNILESLKAYRNKLLTYSPPPALYNNDMVVIRYVESPKKFFVQKVGNIRSFDQMMDDLFLHCKKAYTPLQQITKGSACAVKFENAWYRAEILGINQNRVAIRHVDFGNERNVDPGQLCTITERLVQFPVQAVKCCLKGFENAESLSESATVQLEMLAESADSERRHFKCQIFHMEENGSALVNLIDDTIRPELNLMKKLYKLSMPFNKYIGLEKGDGLPYQTNVGYKPDYVEAAPAILNSTQNQDEPITHLTPDWEAGSSHSSETKERHSPSEPRHNKQSYQQQSSRPFRENNNNNRSFREHREPREPPHMTFNGKGGNLPPRFQKQQDDNRKLKENRPNNPFRTSHNSERSESSNNSFVNSQPAIAPPVTTDNEWDDEPAAAADPEEYVPLDFTFKRADIKVPKREEIILCWWVSPHQFYTHNTPRVRDFENMMRQMQLYYKDKSPGIQQSIEVGSKIIARYQKDQVLYRATVLACNETLRKYRVEFFDFGNQATVSANDIWLVEKRFTQVPVMAELCCFDGVVSNYDHKQITSQVEKYLKPGLTLYCNYLRKENNLYYADIEVGGKSLKDLLIEDGTLSSVEPDLSLEMLIGQQIKISIISVKDLLNFQIEIEGCNLKLISSYNDIKFVKSNDYLSREFKNSYEGNSCVTEVIDVSKEKILMLQPIIPLLTNDIPQRICEYPIVYRTFNVKIAFVETENILYAHPVDVDDKLAVLLDEMYNYYSVQGTLLATFTSGTLCAVQSSDGNWYRAQIINSQNSSHEVYYIDYGNSELIDSTENMKVIEEVFCDSSAFAIRFYFPIKSTNSENSALDTIKSLTDGYELTLSILERYKNCWIADIQSNGHSLSNVLKDDYALTQGIDIQYVKNIIDNDRSRKMLSKITVAKTHAPEQKTFEASPESIQSDSGIMGSEQSDDNIDAQNNMTAAYLSHCDNPGRFFLHLTSSYPELVKLQDNIQIVAGSLPALMTSVTGALCIALYTVDDTWYRARIIDSEIMAVQFIDYGNTDVLTDSSYLKEMNVAFENIPPFAIPCALPISPKTTTDWVDEANNIFNEAYEKTIYFDYVTKNPKKNYVNLKIEGQSVVDKLIADGIARKLEVLKSGENGFVSHINNLSDFYIQMESYADGLELIAGHLAGFENFPVLKDNSIGVVCAGLFPEDSCWYRAKILSHSSDGTEVLFIDYGNTAVTTELREISAEIANLPFLSKKCSLRMPDYILGWSDAAEAKFHEMSALGETVFVVELIEPSDHAIIDLHTDNRNILEVLEPLCDRRPNIEIDLNSSMGKDDFTPNDIVIGSNLQDVIISHVNSPTDFYIQRQSERAELDEIVDALNAGVFVTENHPVVNMICSAKYEDDGSYYRAKILSIDDEAGYEVLFIDFGNDSLSKDIRSLPGDLRNKPGLAYHCTLDQYGSIDLFSQSAIDDFFTFTAGHECEPLEVEFINRIEQPWTVSLIRNGLNIYEEMEKCKLENLNAAASNPADIIKEIIDTAINTSLEKFASNEPAKGQETDTVVKEIINTAINTSIEVCVKNDMKDTQDVVKDLIKATINTSLESFAANEAKKDREQTEKVVDELVDTMVNKSVESAETTLEVVVTHVNSPSDFYIRPVSSDCELKEINESLEDAVNYDQVESPAIGAIYAGLCPIRKIYNRVKILSVQDDRADVELIDSGNRSHSSDLRILSEALRNKQPLTKHCALKTSFNDSMTESFKSLILLKSLQMKIFDTTSIPWIVSLALDHVDIQEELTATEIVHDAIDASVNEIIKNAVVSHTNSPNEFYVQLISDTKNLEKITDSLYDAANFTQQTKPAVGMLCAAVFPDDGAFYRAKILSVGAESCEVLFVDFGNVSISEDIRILPTDLENFELIAKQCALENVTETDFWSDPACEIFSSLVTAHFGETFQIEILSKAEQQPWIVRLFYNSTNLGNELTKILSEQNNAPLSQESSDVWEEAHNSSAGIIASELIDNLIDSVPNDKFVPVANKKIHRDGGNSAGSSSAKLDISTSSDTTFDEPLTSSELAAQLWEGLRKLGITTDFSLKNSRASSTSNLCDRNSKAANSVSARLSVQSDSNRSKSAECFKELTDDDEMRRQQ